METRFKTLIGFMEHYKDEETCLKAFEAARFRNGEYCPHCGNVTIYRFKDGKRFRCAGCKEDFTIKTGTVFGESKVAMRKWFIAIYLLTTAKKGGSSVQLASQVGVTQKTAWVMDHRIRKAMKQNTAMRTVEQHIITHCQIGSKIFTDDYASYNRVKLWFSHEKVSHSTGEYARKGGIHSNGAESFWALFKRGYIGIYHSMSTKHLQRYVDEFTYRFNARQTDFVDVFHALISSATDTTNLPYKVLTA